MSNINDIPDIRSLQKEKQQKENIKNNIFSTVLNKCIEKIVSTNNSTDKTFIIFEVPRILIGITSYDMNACILYLIKQLSAKEYKVDFIEPCYLYIDWGRPQNSSNQKKDKNILTDKLKIQTKKLLKQFPNASKVEYKYT
jgi:hypothetical protein